MIYLFLGSSEIVRRLESTGDTLLKIGVSTIIRAQNRVLESTGVKDIHIELAILAGLSEGNPGADGRNIGVEDQSDRSPVIRNLVSHSTLRTSISTVSNTLDLDLSWVGALKHNVAEGDAGSGGDEGEDGKGSGELHVD